MTATRPGKALAEELQAERHSATLHPTLARLIEAVALHTLTEALYFRLLGQSSAHLSISTTGLWGRLTHVPERQPAWNPVRFWRVAIRGIDCKWYRACGWCRTHVRRIERL